MYREIYRYIYIYLMDYLLFLHVQCISNVPIREYTVYKINDRYLLTCEPRSVKLEGKTPEGAVSIVVISGNSHGEGARAEIPLIDTSQQPFFSSFYLDSSCFACFRVCFKWRFQRFLLFGRGLICFPCALVCCR